MSYYRRLIEESEKKRILGMHNTYKHNPKTWVIREAYTGKPGDGGFQGNVAACKKTLPYDAAMTLGLVKNMTDWGQLKKDWGSDGSRQKNEQLRDAICDGWRKGDPKDGGAQTLTGEQPGATGTGEQPGATGTGEQPGATGTGEQPGATGKQKFIEPIF